MEDLQIIDMFFQRNPQALAETSRKYDCYLNRVSYNILHSREDAEEVVQDTYFRAWNHIPPEKPAELRYFLSRITRNLSINRLEYYMAKRRNPGAMAVFSELDECVPDHRNSMERKWAAKEIVDVIHRFLGGLSDVDCAMFLARYYYAASIRDVAKKYGLSERTVKYRLARMRKVLKICFEKEGVFW